MTRQIKHVVVDGQILQTGAWHRGMGKYTLQVLKEMSNYSAANRGVVFYLMLNNNLGRDEARIQTLQYLCPELQLLHLDLPLPPSRQTDESVEAYVHELDQKLQAKLPDAPFEFFMTSLFFFDFFAEFPSKAYRSLLFYDLTPLLFWRDLGGYFPPDLYMARFKRILEAQTIYSISETTKNDLVATFGVDPASVVNINGGFSRIAERSERPISFTAPEQYILLPTGDLPHKNNEIAVAGFEAYAANADSPLKLLITSRFSEASKRQLKAVSPNIIFTENVSDEELEWLYENAAAVMFASKYEGLGIPILDAVANGKPVITSHIPVFKEMSKDLFFYFDPESVSDLSKQIALALDGKSFAQRQAGYPEILERYTWKETFKQLWLTMGVVRKPTALANASALPRVAIACLHPGIAGQLGRQVEALHGRLSAYYNIDYFFDANGHHYREMERPSFLDYMARKTFDISALTLEYYAQYDAILFVVDEQAIPSRLMQRAVIMPGTTVCMMSKRATDDTAWHLIEGSQKIVTVKSSLANEADKIYGAIVQAIVRHHILRQAVRPFTAKRTIIERLYKTSHD